MNLVHSDLWKWPLCVLAKFIWFSQTSINRRYGRMDGWHTVQRSLYCIFWNLVSALPAHNSTYPSTTWKTVLWMAWVKCMCSWSMAVWGERGKTGMTEYTLDRLLEMLFFYIGVFFFLQHIHKGIDKKEKSILQPTNLFCIAQNYIFKVTPLYI